MPTLSSAEVDHFIEHGYLILKNCFRSEDVVAWVEHLPGWHKDGDFFRHFLDSPEQGLLTIVLWTDMYHQGGGTFIGNRCGSTGRILSSSRR